MAYSPPPFPSLIVLQGGYTPPSLALLLALCEEWTPDDIEGILLAVLPFADVPLTLAAVGTQELEVWSDVGPGAWLPSVDLAPRASSARLRGQEMQRAQTPAALDHAHAAPMRAGIAVRETAAQPLHTWADLLHADGVRLARGARAPQAEMPRLRDGISLTAAEALPVRAGARALLAECIYTRRGLRIASRDALPTAHRLADVTAQALPTAHRLRMPHTEAMWPLTGRWWPRYTPPPLELILCCLPQPLTPGGPIVLRWDYPVCSLTPIGPETIVVPIRRVYLVINTVTLVRARDGAPIDCTRLSLSLDASAWTWTWSANLPGSQLALLRTGSMQEDLIATINGEPIHLRIDSIRRARSFGQSALSVSGRGLASVLASPVAPSVSRYNTSSATAQQILASALTNNGVPIGWAVDWELEDWNVPAGSWSHTGTYIEAATRIAEAGGGYIQGHDTDEILHVRPWYPLAPWDWAAATPDVILPEDVCRTEGLEWRESPAYDAVWITGGAGGRRDRIKRAGTAGTIQAQTIVDDLATDTVMTRQRGLKVLSDCGLQAFVTVSLPVVQETGLIRPGQLVRYTEQGITHCGMSRALSVEAAFPAVWQSVKLETRP